MAYTIEEVKRLMPVEAVDFLQDKYGFDHRLRDHLLGIKIRWTRTSKRAKHWPFNRRDQCELIRIPIMVVQELGFYKRRRIPLKFPGSGWVKVHRDIHIPLGLVHEYTHAIQHWGKRKGCEVETTLNEFAMMRERFPSLYARLIPAHDG
jgi:hypothetical protein